MRATALHQVLAVGRVAHVGLHHQHLVAHRAHQIGSGLGALGIDVGDHQRRAFARAHQRHGADLLVRFGTLGAHAITYTNAATGIQHVLARFKTDAVGNSLKGVLVIGTAKCLYHIAINL